jgi:hypothetical protein
MPISHRLPWQVNVAAKIVLSRMPISYRIWKRVGFFKLGSMDRPEYAYSVFRRHFDAVGPSARQQGFVCLEVGPGDSLASAVIASAFGASETYMVDVGAFATSELAPYHKLASYLCEQGHELPCKDFTHRRTLSELMAVCHGNYLTRGLQSLREIPSESIDFIFSHASLQKVRRAEFLPLMKELRRIQKRSGAGSYTVSMRDLIGGTANDLRFSSRSWESPLMAGAGFYTNRIRYSQMLNLFKLAGFEPEVTHVGHWDKLPISKAKLAPEFCDLSDEDLLAYEWDVVLH